jgi:hypothetical protein
MIGREGHTSAATSPLLEYQQVCLLLSPAEVSVDVELSPTDYRCSAITPSLLSAPTVSHPALYRFPRRRNASLTPFDYVSGVLVSDMLPLF